MADFPRPVVGGALGSCPDTRLASRSRQQSAPPWLPTTRILLLPATSSRQSRTDLPAAQSLARIVHGAALWSPPQANCLPTALILCRLLGRRGLEAELRLGVGKPEGEFAAHAWVEHAGVALGEPENAARTFAALGGASLSNGM